ncbi:hypothetical protein VTH06DRAFT_5344 [Thermothelomyces fergusii]
MNHRSSAAARAKSAVSAHHEDVQRVLGSSLPRHRRPVNSRRDPTSSDVVLLGSTAREGPWPLAHFAHTVQLSTASP